MRLVGRILRHTPLLRARVASHALCLGGGDLRLIIDTGFTDEFALPRKVMRRLKARLIAREPFELADGREVLLDVHEIRVRLGKELETVTAVHGSGLVGMTFLERRFTEMHVHLKRGRVEVVG